MLARGLVCLAPAPFCAVGPELRFEFVDGRRQRGGQHGTATLSPRGGAVIAPVATLGAALEQTNERRCPRAPKAVERRAQIIAIDHLNGLPQPGGKGQPPGYNGT